MNTPFVPVVLSVAAGLAALVSIDPIAPGLGAVAGLMIMGGSFYGASRLVRRRADASTSSAIV